MITLLHLSDLHVNKAQELYLNGVADGLLADLAKLKKTGIEPDLVCVTGDLINAGDNAFQEFQLAETLFLNPIRKALNFSEDRFVFIAGNHEVERCQVSEAVEAGIKSLISDQSSFSHFYEKCRPGDPTFDTIARKLSAFSVFRASRSKIFRKHESYFYDIYNFDVNGLSVGIAAVNSAWRCSQFGTDVGRLVIGERVMREAGAKLTKTDLRVLLCHHPFQFLTDWDIKDVGQRAIKDFHLLLNGHVHDSNALFGHYIPGQLFSSTAGSLRPQDPFSSYSIIQVEPKKGTITCHFRKWYKEREQFDSDLGKCEAGCRTFEGLTSSTTTVALFASVSSCRTQVLATGNDVDFVSPSEGIEQLHLREVFVDPVIREVSNYESTTSDTPPVVLQELIVSPGNLLFVGRPEYGKTTLLLYIQDQILREDRKFGDQLPLYLRFESIPKTNVIHFLRVVARKVPLLKEEQVIAMLEQGKFIFLLDDVNDRQDPERERKCKILREFAGKYPKCRYILTTTELMNPPMRLEILSMGTDFNAKLCFVASLNTSRIRELLTRWRKHETFDLEQMLGQILYYFQHCQIPVTPLAVTLFFGVLFRKKREKNIRNEAYLIENYLETILEKVSPRKHDSQMDFRDKEDFLSHIALEMCERKSFQWPLNDFERVKLDYFDAMDEEVPESAMFDTFFKRGILVKDDGFIQFKRRFWLHFFLAKALEKSPKAEQELLKRPDVLRFSKALGYKAGLTRNDLSLLQWVDDQLMAETQDLRSTFEHAELRDKAEDGVIRKLTDGIEEEIKAKNNPTRVDPHRDSIYLNYSEDTGRIDEGEVDRLQELLTLQSDALRNTSQINVADKRRFIQHNVDCYIALMWATLTSLKELFHTTKEDDLLKLFFRGKTDASTREKLRIIIALSQRIVYHAVPVSVILFMVDHLGTPKLARSFKELGEKSASATKRLFYSILLFSQKPSEGFLKLKEIVGPTSSQSEDFIIVHFLRYYCRENVVPEPLLDKVVALMSAVYKKYARVRLKDEPYLRTGTLAADLKAELKRAQD